MKFIKNLTLTVLIAIAVGILINKIIQSILTNSKPIELVKITFDSLNSKNSKKVLKNAVDDVLKDTEGIYSVVVKNLKTGESYYLNENKNFEAGSLYKLWVMAESFEQINAGLLAEEEVLKGDIAQLNRKFNINPDSAEQTIGTITITVGDAIKQIIVISHNYAALLLVDRLKMPSIQELVKQYGFSGSAVGIEGAAPTTTPYDTALFFEKLYKGEIVNRESSDKMLDILKKQKLNNKLPKGLPENIPIAHKTGEIGWFSHDGGIVYAPFGDYIIVVLSQSQYPLGAQERLAQISKAVYEYFQNQK